MRQGGLEKNFSTVVPLHTFPGVPIFKLGNIEIGTMPTSLTALWKVRMGPFRSLEMSQTGHPFDVAQGAEALEALARGFRGKGQGVFRLKT